MIEYRDVSRRELEATSEPPRPGRSSSPGDLPRVGVQSGQLSWSRLKSSQDIPPDAVCAIVALEEGQLVGKIQIVYGVLEVEGKRQPCAIGAGFFVLEAYRNRGVGLAILVRAMKLGYPYIEASVSGEMGKILDALKGRFTRVDASPVYQVPCNWPGILRLARWEYYESDQVGTRWSGSSEKLRKTWLNWRRRRALHRPGSRIVVEPSSRHQELLTAHRELRSHPVLVPWSDEVMHSALAGTAPQCRAWFVSRSGEPSQTWLVSIYLRARVLGSTDTGEDKVQIEAVLNEVHPPLDDEAPVQELLAFVLREAQAINASMLHINAMTSAMVRACRDLGLGSRASKKIYVAVDRRSEHAAALTEPHNWWCRAINESQFEETFEAPDKKAHDKPAAFSSEN